MRDSQSLLEQVLSFCDGNLSADQVHSMLGTADDERLHALAKAMANRDAASAMKQMDEGIDAGVDAGRLAEQLLGYFRDLMAVTVGCDPSMMRHTSASLHGELKTLGDEWGLQTVLAVVGLIDQTLVRIRHSVYARVLLESTVIQICNLPDLQNLADLAAAASQSGGKAGGAAKKKRVAAERVASQSTDQSSDENGEAIATESDSSAGGNTEPISVASTTQSDSQNPEAASNVTSSAAVVEQKALTPSTVSQVWQQAISQLEPGSATMVQSVEKVELADGSTIRLTFPAEARLSHDRFESGQNKQARARFDQSDRRSGLLHTVPHRFPQND